MTKLIPLTHGLFALVDDGDYERLATFNWQAAASMKTGKWYARRGIRRTDGLRTTSQMHREILDAPPSMEVDHINHDTLDNRRSNLRLVTHAQNGQNRRGADRRGRTGVRGVCWDARARKFLAHVKVNGRLVNLGRFASLAEADQAARDGRRRYMTHSAESDGRDGVSPQTQRMPPSQRYAPDSLSEAESEGHRRRTG